MEKKRSVGLTILGIIFIFLGGLFTLFVSLTIIYVVINEGLRGFGLITLSGALNWIIEMGFPLVLLAVGIGLLFLKPWARKIALFVIPLLIIIFFLHLAYIYCRALAESYTVLETVLSHKKFFAWALLIAIVLISPLLIYLTRPKVKKQFKGSL